MLHLHKPHRLGTQIFRHKTDDKKGALRGSSWVQMVKYYPDGKMSKHINELKVGDELECKGPIMKLEYKANMKKAIGMVRAIPHHPFTVHCFCCTDSGCASLQL